MFNDREVPPIEVAEVLMPRALWGWALAALAHVVVIGLTLVRWPLGAAPVDVSAMIVPVDLVRVADSNDIAPAARHWSPNDRPVENAPSSQGKPETAMAPSAPRDGGALKPPPYAAPALPAETPLFVGVATAPPVAAPRASMDAAPPDVRLDNRPRQGAGGQVAMTLTLPNALRSAIASCWTAPAGVTHLERYPVSFALTFDPDGSVSEPPQLLPESTARAIADPALRTVADAIRRAIYTCAPYRLPAADYGRWRRIELSFDPSNLGR